jgi:hypothetical protein
MVEVASEYSEYFANAYKISYTSGSSSATVIAPNFDLGRDTVTDTSGDSFETGDSLTNTGRFGSLLDVNMTFVGTATDSSTGATGIVVEITTGPETGYWFLTNDTTGNCDSLTVTSPTGHHCFTAGTMIAIPSGEAAVETLKAGDLATLADGSVAPISWLGRQTVSTLFADPLRVQPIRIKASALADGVPSRDLLTSPDHAIFVDGILAHASALVNNVSIVREANMPSTFMYYHVEVADHSLILAENTPAETFIDNVDRMAFDNWEEHIAAVSNNFIPEMAYPRAKAARQVPQTIRARLLARAETLYGERNAA